MEWILIGIVVAAAADGGIPFLGATGRRLAVPTTTLVLAVSRQRSASPGTSLRAS